MDVLVAEIGSTTTVVNGFWLDNQVAFAGSGQAPTTVEEGDVTLGLAQAIEDLRGNLGVDCLEYDELMATSSAAGGLKMTVHGLVYDMTVKAAKEAALGAGANIHMVTAGKLRPSDLEQIKRLSPNIILLAGGVDFGERDTALYNGEKIAGLNLGIPVIYAGNRQNQEEIRQLFEGTSAKLYLVENVYPSIDQLNVEPTRKVIQEVFETHITHGPGMAKVREMVTGHIMPTPAGVMAASKVIGEILGDVVTIDVGGATTDIHSVTEGSEEIAKIMIAPEPKAKRTVEGDLGVYVNMRHVVDVATKEALMKKLNIDEAALTQLMDKHPAIPKTALQKRFVEALTQVASQTALERHAGSLVTMYSTAGRKKAAQGKDLTAVKTLIGTGGALTRLPGAMGILENLTRMSNKSLLLPGPEASLLIDKDYIMASLGVLSKDHKEAAIKLLKASLDV